ncbi:MAG: hypothetical protein U5O39_01265 [Gammaproteobacteria bacterium]|nr:hypothetical protein [Gammaproteobacteria bacterium]
MEYLRQILVLLAVAGSRFTYAPGLAALWSADPALEAQGYALPEE